MADAMSSRILVRNLLTVSLQTFLAALEECDLDQVHRLRRGADLPLDVGRVGGLDVFDLKTTFDNIYQIVDASREASTTDAVAIFNLEIKENMTKVEKRLTELAAEEVEQMGVAVRVETTINKKKEEITEVVEQIVALRERMSQLN